MTTNHSISGGGFPSPSQQNVTLWPDIRILLFGWIVTNGATAIKHLPHINTILKGLNL